MLKMDMEYTKGILFVRLDGVLDRKNCYKLNNYIVPVILKHKIKYLVYNMYLLEDIDSSGIEANKGKICICEVASDVKKEIKKLRIKETASELTAMDLIKV